MKYTLIEEKGQCALILRGESMTQYAVVSGLDKKTGRGLRLFSKRWITI